MQAFGSNVRRETRGAGGAVGRESSPGRAQHSWARGGDAGKGRAGGRGVDSDGRGGRQARPRLTHCTTCNFISFLSSKYLLN